MYVRSRFLPLAALLLVSCGSEEATTVAPAFETTIPSVEAMSGLYAEIEGLSGGRRASMNPSVDAGVTSLPLSSGWTMELGRAYTGFLGSTTYDVNGDGAAEIVSSLRVDTQGAIAWWRADDCRIAWKQGDQVRLAVAGCGSAGGLVCVYDDAVACTWCDAALCAPCVVTGTAVECDAIPVPEPEPEPDVVETDTPEPDAGPEDTVESDTGGESDGGGESDAVVDDASTGEDSVGPGPDPVEPSASCDSACVESNGGVCCTECGCQATAACTPVCGGDYEWDCALQCCYNYDLFACDCPRGSTWDSTQECCSAGGACLEDRG